MRYKNFTEAYNSLYPELVSYVKYKIKNETDSEDVAQAVLIRLLERQKDTGELEIEKKELYLQAEKIARKMLEQKRLEIPSGLLNSDEREDGLKK